MSFEILRCYLQSVTKNTISTILKKKSNGKKEDYCSYILLVRLKNIQNPF